MRHRTGAAIGGVSFQRHADGLWNIVWTSDSSCSGDRDAVLSGGKQIRISLLKLFHETRPASQDFLAAEKGDVFRDRYPLGVVYAVNEDQTDIAVLHAIDDDIVVVDAQRENIVFQQPFFQFADRLPESGDFVRGSRR